MYNLEVQSKAHKDAERIDDYIRFTLFNEPAANDFIDTLEKKYKQIANNPHIFSVEYINGIFYRKALVKKYVVIFRIDEQNHIVYIIAIGHSLQKRKNIVKQNPSNN